jgi:putative endonuclease
MDEADDLVFSLARSQQQRAQRRRRRTTVNATAGMSRQPAPVSASQRQGDLAEQRAARYLTARGLRLLAVNLRCKAGEIDLLMRDGSVLVFVEVRSRSNTRFGGALASVGHRKRDRLIRTARYFLHTTWQGEVPRCRFDVVAFDGECCCWVRDAFGETP